MIETLLIVFIYLIPALIPLYVIVSAKPTGTDHYYHQLLIDSIRNNNHRFVKDLDNFIVNTYVYYPQLLHWILSFFPQDKSIKLGKYSIILFNLSSSLALFFFSTILFDYLNIELSQKEFLLLTGVIYALTPYNYDLENAKNLSVSARGLGLFLGQLNLYILLLFMLNDTGIYLYLGLSTVLLSLIMLSSQFAIQYILFSLPLLAIYYQNIFILLPFILALIFLKIFMPNIIGLSFKGQLNHKKIYFKYLANRFILKDRPSVWRDFVYDFWKTLREKNKSIPQKLGYIITNPVVVLISSIPFFLFILALILIQVTLGKKISFDIYILLGPIIISFGLFLIFCFRKLRFLGEPERYIEFSIGILSIITIILLHESPWLKIILIYSFTLIIIRYYIYIKTILKKRSNKLNGKIEILKNKLLSNIEKGEDIRLLCNGTQVSKIFFHPKIKQFWVTLNNLYTGPFHFNELFNESYHFINPKLILPLIKEFKYNYLLIDTNLLPDYIKYITTNEYRFDIVEEIDNFKLFKIC